MAFLEVFGGALALVAGRKFYDDALRPPAKELGKAGAAAVRAIRAAGIGPEQAVELRDDLVAFIGRAVRRVPEANQVEPPPQILGPVLEQLRYEPIDTPIAEMLEAILARSMDKDRLFEAHPAFVHIVRQLAPDEVRLLRHLTHGPSKSIVFPNIDSAKFDAARDLPHDLLNAPQAFDLYYNHLTSLDLCTLESKIKAYHKPRGAPAAPDDATAWIELYLMPLGKALMRAAELSTAPAAGAGEHIPSA